MTLICTLINVLFNMNITFKYEIYLEMQTVIFKINKRVVKYIIAPKNQCSKMSENAHKTCHTHTKGECICLCTLLSCSHSLSPTHFHILKGKKSKLPQCCWSELRVRFLTCLWGDSLASPCWPCCDLRI